MVPTGITTPFEMIEAELGFEVAILDLDGPLAARQRRERPQRRVRGMIGEVVPVGGGGRLISAIVDG
jgi:hypothetical protein